MKKLNNSGVTLVETLIAFMIICVGVVMLMGCIVTTINVINNSKDKNIDTQNKVNTFWAKEAPDSTGEATITVKYPGGSSGGTFKVRINEYNVAEDETYFEYAEYVGDGG